uniref:Adenylyltransferase and sulfurtransferase MOCS3 homolog n=1 Tax=Lutzomyia longipalpis TaxID=7200 RepID=A0A7G3AT46_LUTLO
MEEEITELRDKLAKSEEECKLISSVLDKPPEFPDKLSNNEIARYSRQVLVPGIGVEGQVKLRSSSALIIGAGGLGCPAALYLAAAGIGMIAAVDYDKVDLSNLHRQTLYSERDVGISKVFAMGRALDRIHSKLRFDAHNTAINSTNAMTIIEQYDIVLDATDNVATRYLLSDACVLAKKPLVSGSAIQFDGQLTVYNYKDGPCYRCIHTQPPNPDHVQNCGDSGVMGPVTGVIGSLMALEAIKVLLNLDGVLSKQLLVYDGFEARFRTLKLRGKIKDCASCSENPTITQLIDYEAFCGSKANDKDYSLKLLDESDRITVQEYRRIFKAKIPHVLVDVRPPNEIKICALKNTKNIPIDDINSQKIERIAEDLGKMNLPIYVVCRRGNDSQRAVKKLKEFIKGDNAPKDIIGGLHAWAKYIDRKFPVY